MELSTLYIPLVFLVPVALGFTLLSAMASDLDLSRLVAARSKITSTVKSKIAIKRAQECNGCYA